MWRLSLQGPHLKVLRLGGQNPGHPCGAGDRKLLLDRLLCGYAQRVSTAWRNTSGSQRLELGRHGTFLPIYPMSTVTSTGQSHAQEALMKCMRSQGTPKAPPSLVTMEPWT